VETFFQLAVPKGYKHAFFVAGGALGIENALKASFDWKVQRNFEKGYRREVGHRVICFDHAFHGRTGYTMTLTKTEPVKYMYYPRFDWPRALAPMVKFPLDEENLRDVQQREELALKQVKQYFREYRDDIAAIIIEPIQGEGGDNHFRGEFLRALKEIADEEEAMLIFDCVQAGMGLTGKMWTFEHFDMQPDMFCFGKKTQVCGFVANDKIDSVEDNVFKVSSRINSTWGGNITDMVRCAKYLEIIHEEKLVDNAEKMGKVLLRELEKLQAEFPEVVSNARGRGLMCAFDLPSTAERDRFRAGLYDNGVAILGSGEKTIRFRPPLNIEEDHINMVMDAVRETLKKLY
jgi:L-lysine 6-transaminase